MCADDQETALLEFYTATNGPSWIDNLGVCLFACEVRCVVYDLGECEWWRVSMRAWALTLLAGWNTETPYCNWARVACTGGVVTSLYVLSAECVDVGKLMLYRSINKNNLSGTLPSSISLLTNLTRLYVLMLLLMVVTCVGQCV